MSTLHPCLPADDDFLVSIALPLAIFIVIAGAFLWSELRRGKEVRPSQRPPTLGGLSRAHAGAPQEYSDPETGAMWEANVEAPEMDRQGRLVFQASSYTPWPVPPSAPGERMRLAVGPIDDRTMRTYLFDRRAALKLCSTLTCPGWPAQLSSCRAQAAATAQQAGGRHAAQAHGHRVPGG